MTKFLMILAVALVTACTAADKSADVTVTSDSAVVADTVKGNTDSVVVADSVVSK